MRYVPVHLAAQCTTTACVVSEKRCATVLMAPGSRPARADPWSSLLIGCSVHSQLDTILIGTCTCGPTLPMEQVHVHISVSHPDPCTHFRDRE
jgi:hypothetical protein